MLRGAKRNSTGNNGFRIAQRLGHQFACLEALATGIPVVASDTGGTSEIIREGETGYLCPSTDLDRFADRVVRLLRDPDLRARLGRNGRALVERRYSWTRVAEITEKLYERLV